MEVSDDTREQELTWIGNAIAVVESGPKGVDENAFSADDLR